MSQSCNGLHFNGVSLIKRVIQNTWRVNNLPSGVLVIGVSNEQVLGSESVGLNVNISIRDIVDKAGFTDIGEAGNDQGAGVGVDRRQSAQMLSDFFKIAQGRLKFLQQGTRATECSSLQLLGAIKRVGVLQKTHVVTGDAISDRFSLVTMTESELVMIFIVQHVHQISVEGVNIVQFGETIDNRSQFLIDRFLHKLDFTHVEFANSLDFETLAHLCGRLALRLGQHDVDQIVSFGDLDDLLEVIGTTHLKLSCFVYK